MKQLTDANPAEIEEFAERHERLTVTCINEFVDLHSKLSGRWIFRGQSNADDEPVPAIDREPARRNRPSDGSARGMQESKALEEFKRQARRYLDHPPQSDWEWIAVARHRGLWTRLLDWTENALAALYFAVEDPDEARDSAVFCFLHRGNPSHSKNPLEQNELAVYYPPHIAPRIAAQSACFTVHPAGMHQRKSSTENILERVWPEPAWWTGLMRTIVIENRHRTQIREQLKGFGIHRATLFPEADGVAALLNMEIRGDE